MKRRTIHALTALLLWAPSMVISMEACGNDADDVRAGEEQGT